MFTIAFCVNVFSLSSGTNTCNNDINVFDTDGRPCGFIKLAMAVSKGSLEVEIICATGLLFHGEAETLGER